MAADRRPGRHLARRLRLALAVIFGVGLVVVVAALAAWRSQAVRQSAIARASDALERRAGVRLAAEDLVVALADGRIELVGPRLAAGASNPFLSADRVVVEVDVGSLWRPPLVIRRLLVEAPVLDLSARLPTPPAGPAGAAEPPQPLPRLEQVRIAGGTVRGGSVPDAARPWLDAWAVEDIEATGSVGDGVLALDLERARVRLARTEPGTDELQVSFVVTGPLVGPLGFRDLSVIGDGLILTGRGQVVVEPELALAADLDLETRPGRIVPARGIDGIVHVTGSVASRPIAAALTVSAADLAVDAARPFVDAGTFARLGAASTVVDVQARVTLAGDLSRPEGSATVNWRRAGEVLARADADLTASAGGLVAGLEAALLPGSDGVRELRVRIAAKSLAGLATGRFDEAIAAWEADDLAAELERLRAGWPHLVPAPPPALDLAGPMAVHVSAAGAVTDPVVAAEGSWRPALGGAVRFDGSGRPVAREGRARVVLSDLPVALASAGATGTVGGEVTAAGSLAAYVVEARLDGRDVAAGGELPRVDSFHVEAVSDGATVEVTSLSATVGAAVLEASGTATLARPFTDAVLEASVRRPVPEIDVAAARVVLAGGTLRVQDGIVESPAGTAFFALEAPLGAVAELPQAKALRDLPLRFDRGPLHVTVFAPDLDSCLLADAFGLPDRAERVRADVAAELWLDPAMPALATGSLRAAGLEAAVSGRTAVASGPFVLRLGQGEVSLEPLQVLVAGTGVRLQGWARLREGWRFGDDPRALVERFSGEAAGSVEAAMLQPYLIGAVAAGSLDFSAAVSGTPDDPRATVALRGDDASLAWTTPYPLRVSRPVFEGSYGDGAFTLWSGTMEVNSGTVSLRGTMAADGRGELQAELEGLRLRLAYGLRAILSGDTVLTLWPGERPLLSGTIVVDRGVLDRDLDLEREVLGQFMAPVVTAGTEDNPLERVDLDLAVVTADGVRVKNNLADLTARWDRLEIGGTAWNPLIRGTVAIDPGGLVHAYGQTVRIDRGELQFTGDPIADPRIELTTTGSWQDPTIPVAGEEASAFAPGRAEEGAEVLEAFSTGIAGYYGERVASRIGESLGLGRVSLRPVLVFGETDPSARLTISRDLSRSVALAVSLDLRNAQRQTYVLDLRDLPRLGAFRAQAFTNDEGNAGGSLQQVLELGGSRVAGAGGPTFRRVVWEAPDELPRRVLGRAVSLERGEPLPEGAAFDLEIELEHELRRAGWPAASVAVAERPDRGGDGVELVASVDPGPRVRFAFTGDAPPKGLRPGITDLYRPGAGEAATREEVRKQAVRVLRGAGYLDPEVEVATGRDDGGAILVTVHSRGGPRVDLGPPRFEGVPAAVGARLAERFPSAVERAELAVGLPDADRRVLAALRDLGYPTARIAGRSITPEGRELVVALEPGALRTVAEVTLAGVEGGQLAQLRGLVPLASGDPLRRDLIARGAAAVEEQLRAQGYARAAVRAVVEDVPGDELAAAVRFEVRPGQRYEIGEISVVGNRWSGGRAVKKLAALETGAPYRSADVAAARGRLLRTGVYRRVIADTELGEGQADVELQLVERPRFQLAYGVRWESEVGASAVVDLLDRNLLGRGVTAGVRLRWEPDDRSARLFVTVPEVLGWPVTVETYGERRREVRGGLVRNVGEGALQLSLDVGRFTTGRAYARYRDTRLAEVDPDPFFPFEVRITHPYLGFQLLHDRRDDLLQPRSGVLATLDVSGSGSFLGSDFAYVRGFGQVNFYLGAGRLGGRGLTWAQSYRVGVAHAFDQELIPDARFYAGGEFSLRGYPTEGVGPVDALGGSISPRGGEALLVVNQELRLALPWDLTGVGFVDLGGVWADVGDFGTDLVTALGVGVRASTPVGLLRVDFAVPLDRRDWEPRYKLYAGFGNAF